VPRYSGATISYVFDWDQEDALAALRRHYAAGFSASQIAAMMADEFGGNLSRNAIIGKVHRLGLTGRGGATKRPQAPRRPRAASAQRPEKPNGQPFFSVARARARAQAEPDLGFAAEPLPDDGALPAGEGVTLLELTDSTCRWPHGQPGQGDFRYCGKPGADMRERRPYCPGHTAKASGPPTRTMSEQERDRRSAAAARRINMNGPTFSNQGAR
jgi:GcrA cell cycle regulator